MILKIIMPDFRLYLFKNNLFFLLGIYKATRVHCDGMATETYSRRILVSRIRSRVLSSRCAFATATQFSRFFLYCFQIFEFRSLRSIWFFRQHIRLFGRKKVKWKNMVLFFPFTQFHANTTPISSSGNIKSTKR